MNMDFVFRLTHHDSGFYHDIPVTVGVAAGAFVVSLRGGQMAKVYPGDQLTLELHVSPLEARRLDYGGAQYSLVATPAGATEVGGTVSVPGRRAIVLFGIPDEGGSV